MVANFRDHLTAAEKRGAVHKVTTNYVKVRWWSPKAYFSSMSSWRTKRIGKIVGRRLERIQKKAECSKTAKAARDNKRASAIESAVGSINDSLVNMS